MGRGSGLRQNGCLKCGAGFTFAMLLLGITVGVCNMFNGALPDVHILPTLSWLGNITAVCGGLGLLSGLITLGVYKKNTTMTGTECLRPLFLLLTTVMLMVLPTFLMGTGGLHSLDVHNFNLGDFVEFVGYPVGSLATAVGFIYTQHDAKDSADEGPQADARGTVGYEPLAGDDGGFALLDEAAEARQRAEQQANARGTVRYEPLAGDGGGFDDLGSAGGAPPRAANGEQAEGTVGVDGQVTGAGGGNRQQRTSMRRRLASPMRRLVEEINAAA